MFLDFDAPVVRVDLPFAQIKSKLNILRLLVNQPMDQLCG
jgi:hypothetical protein